MGEGRACAACGAPALRPDIVFFGEMPYAMDRIERALAAADLFVSIGTSGAVYPAAGFVQTARYAEARTEELNLEPPGGTEIGGETCREREGTYVWISGVAVCLKKKKK